MGKGSSPDAPDTVGAARETGEQARRLNEAQTWANRPNQRNAWGSTTWENAPVWDSVTGQYVNNWTQTETLDPTTQATLDAQRGIGLGRANLAEGAMARAWDSYQDPMDFDQFGDVIGFDPTEQRQAAEDAAYARSTSRLDPQFNSMQEDLLTKLRNQGLTAGDQAYDSAVANLGRERTDAYDQARYGATEQGRAETNLAMQQNQLANALRSQGMDESLFRRNFNLGEAERLLGPNPVQGGPPSTGGTTSSGGGGTIASEYGLGG